MGERPYAAPATVDEVRDYVTREPRGATRAADTLLLNVRHSNLPRTRLAELRFNRHAAVADVKRRLHLHTGTPPAAMQLFLCGGGGDVKRLLLRDELSLADAGAADADTLLVVDTDPHSVSANGALVDLSLVPKYHMPDDVYDAKPNTYRRFKQRMRAEQPGWSMTAQLRRNQPRFAADYAADRPRVRVGDRVSVAPGAKRGAVRFVGSALHRLPPGWWVGVAFDEPVGKNDGAVHGVRYFECAPNYGGLVRPSAVQVGHFPPLCDYELDAEPGLDADDEL